MATRSGLQAFLCPTILAVDAALVLLVGTPTCAGRFFPLRSCNHNLTGFISASTYMAFYPRISWSSWESGFHFSLKIYCSLRNLSSPNEITNPTLERPPPVQAWYLHNTLCEYMKQVSTQFYGVPLTVVIATHL